MKPKKSSIRGLAAALEGTHFGDRYQKNTASFVAQLVKNLPAMQESWVGFLGQEDPLEKEMATHSSILGLESPMDRGAWQATVHRVTSVRHDLLTKPPPSEELVTNNVSRVRGKRMLPRC